MYNSSALAKLCNTRRYQKATVTSIHSCFVLLFQWIYDSWEFKTVFLVSCLWMKGFQQKQLFKYALSSLWHLKYLFPFMMNSLIYSFIEINWRIRFRSFDEIISKYFHKRLTFIKARLFLGYKSIDTQEKQFFSSVDSTSSSIFIFSASRLLRRKIPQSGHLMTSKRFWMQSIPNTVSMTNLDIPETFLHHEVYAWVGLFQVVNALLHS